MAITHTFPLIQKCIFKKEKQRRSDVTALLRRSFQHTEIENVYNNQKYLRTLTDICIAIFVTEFEFLLASFISIMIGSLANLFVNSCMLFSNV